MVTLEITDDEEVVQFSETLIKLQMTCDSCKKNVGFVYSDAPTHSNCIGWRFTCARCQVK